MQNFRNILICGISFFALSSCAGNEDYLQQSIAAFGPEDCEPVVEQQIDRLKIDRNKISNIDYLTYHISEGDSGEEYNYQGWVSFNNCKGNFVVDMNKSCQILKTYSLGNCRMEDIVAQN
ncbi:hypothetical protein [Sneathiella litorea]|uniref:Lipoprotein n=1 Tax=Sneathiella litorea TaxID=2606216 RepID=A0A6L8W3M7_9PROT|nr:hypothetical protein [Sneathiella litorea]MZR29299.1 hypothetical protein [Sneathiella litorea]